VFIDRRLYEIYRIETNISRIVIAYSERRRRKIAKDRSTEGRDVRKALRRLREGERKEDVIYKTDERVEEIVRRYSAVLVVGNAHRGKDRMASNANGKSLRDRIHQCCVGKLVGGVEQQAPIPFEISEA
jgi:hypothetical protein